MKNSERLALSSTLYHVSCQSPWMSFRLSCTLPSSVSLLPLSGFSFFFFLLSLSLNILITIFCIGSSSRSWLNNTSCKTRRPLSTGIFSAKNVTHQHGFEPTTSCLSFTLDANYVKFWGKSITLYEK